MDGLTIAASLVGISTAGCQIAVKLYALATQMGTASDRISSISNDVSLTSSILQQVGDLLRQQETDESVNIFSHDGLETAKASAKVCRRIFQRIDAAAREASEQIRTKGRTVGKIRLSKVERVKWPFLQPSFMALRSDLGEAKATLMLML